MENDLWSTAATEIIWHHMWYVNFHTFFFIRTLISIFYFEYLCWTCCQSFVSVIWPSHCLILITSESATLYIRSARNHDSSSFSKWMFQHTETLFVYVRVISCCCEGSYIMSRSTWSQNLLLLNVLRSALIHGTLEICKPAWTRPLNPAAFWVFGASADVFLKKLTSVWWWLIH